MGKKTADQTPQQSAPQPQHDEPHQGIDAARHQGMTEPGGQPGGQHGQAEEPDGGGQSGPQGEGGQRLVGPLGRHAAQYHDGIQIDMGVEQRHPQGGEQYGLVAGTLPLQIQPG